jgi:hypothetical protein
MQDFAHFVVAVAVGALLAACNGGSTAEPRSPDDEATCPENDDPTYRAEIQRICDVDSLLGAGELDPIEAAQRRDDYLVEHVKHPDAIEFLTIFRSKSEPERAEMLNERARALRLTACPLRDRLAAR